MKLILLGLIVAILGYPSTENANPITTERYIQEPQEVEVIFNEEFKIPKFEYEVDKETAIQEVVDYWNWKFDSVGARKTDWRRLDFAKHAESLVHAIRFFQNPNNKVYLERHNRRLILPNGRYLHILFAHLIYKESSVNPNVIGKTWRKEVGLMQLHGVALAGHTKKEVRNNPDLGVWLGVRWLAIEYTDCKLPDNYSIDHWRGPLALYGSTPKKVKKNGVCSTRFNFANKRVRSVKNYIKLVAKI